MELKGAKEFAERTLQIIHPLIESKAKTTAPFENVVLGALRRDYLTLYTITHLSDGKDEDQVAFGDSCMDLARKVFEDLIGIEYIKLKGKEKYSRQFIDFKAVEAYRDLEYLKAAGVQMDPKFVKDTEEEYQKLPSRLKKRKSWAGLDVEGMVKALLDAEVIKKDEFRALSQVYVAGNYKNHFSPTDIFNFLHPDLHRFSGLSDLLLSLVVVASSVTKIAAVLIEETSRGEVLKKEVDALWKDWLVAHLEIKS